MTRFLGLLLLWPTLLWAQGNIEWVERFTAGGHPTCAVELSNGSYLVAGTGDDFEAFYGGMIVSYSAGGQRGWFHFYPNTNYFIEGVAAADDGGFVWTFRRGGHVMKTDAAGAILSDEIYPIGNTRCAPLPAPDGGFYVIGEAENSANSDRVQLLKVSAGGDSVSCRDLRSIDHMALRRMKLCASTDGYYIYGAAWVPEGSYFGGYIIRLDAATDSVWSHYYAGDPAIRFFDAMATPGGGLMLVGSVQTAIDTVAWLGEIDSDGAMIRTQLLPGGTHALTIRPVWDGGFIVSGLSADSAKLWIARLGPDAEPLWDTDFDGSHACTDATWAMQTADSGFLAAACGEVLQYFVVKLDAEPASDADRSQPALPVDLRVSPAWPNPFNPVTRIAFDLPALMPARAAVYDLQGREVACLASGLLTAGHHEVTFDGAALPSGVYLLHVTAGPHRATQKLLLVK